jgi:uncharacterized protein YbjQ (UPF0145 family)
MTVSMSIKPSFNETSTYDQAVERIRDEARKRGADAVVGLKTLDSQDDGASRGQLTLKGTLIQYTAPEPLVTTEPPR